MDADLGGDWQRSTTSAARSSALAPSALRGCKRAARARTTRWRCRPNSQTHLTSPGARWSGGRSSTTPSPATSQERESPSANQGFRQNRWSDRTAAACRCRSSSASTRHRPWADAGTSSGAGTANGRQCESGWYMHFREPCAEHHPVATEASRDLDSTAPPIWCAPHPER